MKTHTLLIDMDSVICDLMSKWFSKYNMEYDDNLTIDQLKCWNTEQYVKKACGTKIYQYLSEPGFYRDLKPLPHAVEVLERLNKRYEIFIVTTSPKSALQDKALWVEEFLPFIGSRHIIFTHHKHMIKGDLLFDDAPHNLEKFMEAGGFAVAMDYTYNESVRCVRASNWLEFESSLEKWLV
jgi:5'-nucleotidase